MKSEAHRFLIADTLKYLQENTTKKRFLAMRAENRDFFAIRKLVSSTLPDMVLTDEVLKEPSRVALFCFEPNGESFLFFKSLAEAIKKQLAPVTIFDAARISKEKKWAQFFSEKKFQLILCPAQEIKQCVELAPYLEQKQTEYFLAKTPLLLLLPPSDYQKTISLKRDLWTHLCKKLKK